MTGSEMRSRAMMINFGVLYGTSPKKIIASRRSGMSSDIHLATALALWQSMSRPRPDFPGGSRLFCHLLKTWTRDMTGPLGLRHEFVQNGPHIACVRCKTSVASFCGDGYDRDEKKRISAGPQAACRNQYSRSCTAQVEEGDAKGSSDDGSLRTRRCSSRHGMLGTIAQLVRAPGS